MTYDLQSQRIKSRIDAFTKLLFKTNVGTYFETNSLFENESERLAVQEFSAWTLHDLLYAMCTNPRDTDPNGYFALLLEIRRENPSLNHLSYFFRLYEAEFLREDICVIDFFREPATTEQPLILCKAASRYHDE